MNSGFSSLTVGMEVRGANAHHVGWVKEVHESDFLVHRRLLPTVEMPIATIRAVTANGVVLTLTEADVDEMYWVHAGEDLRVRLNNIYD